MEELKNKRILLLGSQGMAGHILNRYLLEKGFLVEGLARHFYAKCENEQEFDVSDFAGLKAIIEKGNYHIVINCVGVLIGDSAKDFQRAIQLNADLPRHLSSWSKELGFKVVLISTDCVFDGKIGAYSHRDSPNANDPYGLSKRLGEIINEVQVLTIRTSIIGPELKNGTGLWQWFERQVGAINGYKSVYWSGVTTLELARFIEHALRFDMNGLVQLSNGKPISKFDLLALMQRLGVNTKVQITPELSIKSNKTLIASDLRGFRVQSYEGMVREQHALSS